LLLEFFEGKGLLLLRADAAGAGFEVVSELPQLLVDLQDVDDALGVLFQLVTPEQVIHKPLYIQHAVLNDLRFVLPYIIEVHVVGFFIEGGQSPGLEFSLDAPFNCQEVTELEVAVLRDETRRGCLDFDDVDRLRS
jgi:hypothetical protein